MALLNWELFLERVERNESLAQELAHDLLRCIDDRLEALVYAFGQGDLKPIEHAAHVLRGLVSPYGGHELLMMLKAIEEQARSKDLSYTALPLEISKMVDELKAEVEEKLRDFPRETFEKYQDGPFL